MCRSEVARSSTKITRETQFSERSNSVFPTSLGGYPLTPTLAAPLLGDEHQYVLKHLSRHCHLGLLGMLYSGRWGRIAPVDERGLRLDERGEQHDWVANGRRLRVEFGVILVHQAILDRRNPGNVA
jgi:hypothetical protein